jgi:hypothetical protein
VKLTNFLIMIVIVTAFTSCYKEKTTMVTVRAQDAAGNSIAGAQVRLYAEPTVNSSNEMIADFTKTTNSSGEAYFNLTNLYEPGQTGVGVFKIRGQFQNKVGEQTVEVVQEKNNMVLLTLE